jgi:heme exporter protein D
VSDFFAMGGYAAFVWPAVGVSLFGLVAMALWSWREMRAREAAFAALRARLRGAARDAEG